MKKYLIAGGIAVVVVGLTAWSLMGEPKQEIGYAYNETQTKTLTVTTTADNVQTFTVKGRKDLTIAVINTDGTSTIKFVGSIGTVAGNPLSASTASNQWAYVDLVDVGGGSTLLGSDGITVGGATTSKMYKLSNVNLNYLTPIVTSYITGTASVMLISDEGSNK